MQSLNQQTAELQNMILGNEQKITANLGLLGRGIVEQGPGKINGTPLQDLFNEISSLNKDIPARKKEIQKIIDLEESLTETRASIKEKKKLAVEKEKEIKEHYRQIGESAYQAYKKDTVKNEAYESIFRNLILIEEKSQKTSLSQQDATEASQSEKDGNIVKHFFSMAKSIYYDKKQDLITARQNTLFKQAGKQVMESDFAKTNNDPELDKNIEPIMELAASVKQLQEECNNLENREKGLLKDLAGCSVKSSAAKRIREIEKEIEQISAAIDSKHVALGKSYQEKAGELSINLEGLDDTIREIETLHKENKACREQIVKLDARINIEKCRQKISRNGTTIENLKLRITRDKEEIKNLTEMNIKLEQEITDIAKKHRLELPAEK